MFVRNTDPETSHDASNNFEAHLTTRCKQFVEGLLVLETGTANEVAVYVAGNNIGLLGSIRRRSSDLETLGVIEVVGRRKCKITGKSASVYKSKIKLEGN